MSDNQAAQRRPLRLLALDGGGIRGFSELTILNEIMYRIARKTNQKPEEIRPCDYFDLIGGTSTGGIIAVLLARLQMTARQGLDLYADLSHQVFAKDLLYTRWQIEKFIRSRFDANTLAGVIRKELTIRIPNPPDLPEEISEEEQKEIDETKSDAPLLDSTITPGCRAFVCATPGLTPQVGNPTLFRTYKHRGNTDRTEPEEDKHDGVKIWEALRATSAAPGFFDRIKIGDKDYVDGGLGCNNPSVQVYDEGLTLWKDGERFPEIGCLVSLGTGMPKILPEADEPEYTGVYGISGLWNAITSKLSLVDKQVAEVYLRIATQCEKVHRDMLKKKELKKKYFRFNVQQGLQGISLEEYDRLGEVRVHTEAYMNNYEIDRKLDQLVDKLIKLSSDDPFDWLHA